MSLAGALSSQSTLSGLARTSEPAWVSHGSSSAQQAYEEGVGFEEMLLEQLTQSLAGTAGLGGEGGEGSEEGGALGEEAGAEGGGGEGAPVGAGGSGLLSSLLPHILSESVISGGGLGLAEQMARELDPGSSGSAAAMKAGGTSPAQAGGAA